VPVLGHPQINDSLASGLLSVSLPIQANPLPSPQFGSLFPLDEYTKSFGIVGKCN